MFRSRTLFGRLGLAIAFLCCTTVTVWSPALHAQETTGGIQGVVRDTSGAVIPKAKVVITSPVLVRTLSTTTDSGGYYRFNSLPPGTYAMTVSKVGFANVSRPALTVEVGRLPTVNITMKVGASSATVTVTAAPPQIDLTKITSITNITQNAINYVPHGFSFQSVIEFAPGARNEPLEGAGGSTAMGGITGGTGGGSAGSMNNGGAVGYSIDGAADSENLYLVNGLDTANLIGGYSHTRIPMDFLQSETIDSSGVSAQYGGALGGVINAVTKRGTNAWHGSAIFQYENNSMNALPQEFSQWDPASTGTPVSWGTGLTDPAYQAYQGKKDSGYMLNPGFTIGGPLVRNRLYFFGGLIPEFTHLGRTVNFTSGTQTITQDSKFWYGNGRLDYSPTNAISLFGSWYYAPQREYGEVLPQADSTQGYLNPSASNDPAFYSHNFGFYAPSSTLTTGANFILSPTLVDSVRFGYYFDNYHDFGMPQGGDTLYWAVTSTGATEIPNSSCATPTSCPALPADLQQTIGHQSAAFNQNYTSYDADKQVQLFEDLEWVKSGWWGTHTLRFGYQLNRLSNIVLQHYNQPFVNVDPTQPYTPQGSVGAANCAAVEAADGTSQCDGKYGYIWVEDYGSNGAAISYNHAFYAQDTWTTGHGLTLDLGLRVEKENLPAENQPKGGISTPINFSWSDKIAPRLGAAWDVLGNGKLKLYGGYGVYYDVMKLNLAISSFGGQYWQNCYYALDTSNFANLDPVFNAATRDCVGPNSSSQANFPGGATPTGLTFLENQNFRTFPTTCATCTATEEGVAPGLKPYRQHEFDLGFEYQLTPTLVLSARWDRRRLDHAIEDSAIFNPNIGETFVIVNPGQGVNSTFDGFYNFLYGTSSGCTATSTPSCPNMIPAQRDYDGVEFRLQGSGRHWDGLFSYTWSRLWGNYSGLTSSDISDGGGGRNAPNNSRAFDEPFFQFNDAGGSSSGLLNTDRPNAFKGWGDYTLNEGHRWSTHFGLAQFLYSGTPVSSFVDVGYTFAPFESTNSGFDTYVVDRGKFVDVTQNQTTGAVTVGTPYTRRTPWWVDTDLSLTQRYNVAEGKVISFEATILNLFNRRAVTAYNTQIDSAYQAMFITPGGQAIFNGPSFYSAAMHPYDLQTALNQDGAGGSGGGPMTINSLYGLPYEWQPGRSVRLSVRFTF